MDPSYLRCNEIMTNDYQLCRPKTLYEIARDTLFTKNFYCIYCNMMDYDDDWIQIHTKHCHDEVGITITMFQCKKCSKQMFEKDIVLHEVNCNHN